LAGPLRVSIKEMTLQQQQFGLSEDVAILPPDWPGEGVRELLPGDLTQFAANRGPYRTDLSRFHPFRFDSRTNAGGGLIYFDEVIDAADLATILRAMGVRADLKDYAVFAQSSHDPVQEDYLDQVRIVSTWAIQNGYRIARRPPPQALSVWDLARMFVAGQRVKWTRELLSGTRGGDSDSAKEALGFGFMVEDTEWDIYRIWSRSWLEMK
jgi:hypothetical protein